MMSHDGGAVFRGMRIKVVEGRSGTGDKKKIWWTWVISGQLRWDEDVPFGSFLQFLKFPGLDSG